MLPSFAANNRTNDNLRHAVLSPHLGLRCLSGRPFAANLTNGVFGKFGCKHFFAASAAPLLRAVSGVVAVGSKEQVVWIYAPAVIAAVTHANRTVSRKLAKVNVPRVPMGRNGLSVLKREPAVTIPN